MTREQTVKMARRRIKTRKCHDLPELLLATEQAIEWFAPIVRNGKELTDEFNDFPSEGNKVNMEIARLAVVLAAQRLSEVLVEAYGKLSSSSKRAFPFSEFASTVQTRLVNMLEQ